jgi:multimeric flavodoxin WrbA
VRAAPREPRHRLLREYRRAGDESVGGSVEHDEPVLRTGFAALHDGAGRRRPGSGTSRRAWSPSAVRRHVIGSDERGYAMAKIVVVNGSAKTADASNTHRFAAAFCEDLRKDVPGLEADLISLSERDVQSCRGCMTCTLTGTCAIDDEVPAIRAAIRDSDLLVLASPVHLRHVSSVFQNLVERFLVDLHTFPYVGKPFCTLVTTNGSGEDDALKYLARVGLLLGAIHLGSTFESRADGVDAKGYRRLLKKSAQALKDGSAVKPTLMNSLYFSSMRKIIKENGEFFPYESKSWSDKGWFDKSYKDVMRQGR